MTKPRIIGLTGRRGSGKDTVGNFLVNNYGYKRLAYADPLKEVCQCIFGFSHEQVHGSLKEANDPYWGTTPRAIMQFVGTDLFRNQITQVIPNIHNNIWIKVLEHKVRQDLAKNPDQLFVITDIRFANELELVKQYNGVIFKIKRNKIRNESSDNHASEIEIDNLHTDHEIDNNGTIDELFSIIKSKMDN